MQRRLIISVVFSILLVGIFTVSGNTAELPYWPGDDWRTSTPEAQGIDAKPLAELLETIRARGINLHSLLVIRHGYLVAEAYFDPFRSDMRHALYSCTKSVTSSLVGIAVKEGYIQSIEQKLLLFFPEETAGMDDKLKAQITLKHLLTMTTGGLKIGTSQELLTMENPVAYILSRPMHAEPGREFVYNNAGPHLLSAIIKKTTPSCDTLFYAMEKLFTPLGIKWVVWPADEEGVAVGSAGLSLTPREMAKFGYLYLQDGVWNGKQIVPTAWVKDSVRKQADVKPAMNDAENYGYGYFWWVDSYGGFSAHGTAGQYIFVVPRLDLVAVFTAGLSNADFPLPRKFMESHILPAVKQAGALPINQEANQRLDRIIRELAHPEAAAVSDIPPAAQAVLGKLYVFPDKNIFDLRSLALTGIDNREARFRLEFVSAPGRFVNAAVGLDNLYRQADRMDLFLFMKGQWVDDHTLAIKMVSASEEFTLRIAFMGDRMEIEITETGQISVGFMR